jgi:hypothetical protein
LARCHRERVLEIGGDYHGGAIGSLVTDDSRYCRPGHGGQDADYANDDKELHDGEAPPKRFVIFRHDVHAHYPHVGEGSRRISRPPEIVPVSI